MGGITNVTTEQANPTTQEETNAVVETPNLNYVTADQLAQLEEAMTRRIQSATAKAENRINQQVSEKVQAKINELQAAGITATAEQASALLEAETQRMQPEEVTPQEQNPEAQSKDAKTNWINKNGGKADDPIWQAVYELVSESGIDLENGDVEVGKYFYEANGELIRHTKSSFLNAWSEAIKAKKARLEGTNKETETATIQGEQAEEVHPASVPALGIVGHTNRIRDAKFDEIELLTKAFNKGR